MSLTHLPRNYIFNNCVSTNVLSPLARIGHLPINARQLLPLLLASSTFLELVFNLIGLFQVYCITSIMSKEQELPFDR
jgi:hypothetical protein